MFFFYGTINYIFRSKGVRFAECMMWKTLSYSYGESHQMMQEDVFKSQAAIDWMAWSLQFQGKRFWI